jgi:hypothetical protein
MHVKEICGDEYVRVRESYLLMRNINLFHSVEVNGNWGPDVSLLSRTALKSVLIGQVKFLLDLRVTGRHEHLPRLLIIQRKIGQAVECSPISEDLVFLLDIPAARQVLEVYNILVSHVVYLAELEKREGAGADRVTTRRAEEYGARYYHAPTAR